MNANEILDREFLEIRAKILELAASLDRLHRADGSCGEDPRWLQICRAIDLLTTERPDHAEQIQRLFSREYDPQWRDSFNLHPSENPV